MNDQELLDHFLTRKGIEELRRVVRRHVCRFSLLEFSRREWMGQSNEGECLNGLFTVPWMLLSDLMRVFRYEAKDERLRHLTVERWGWQLVGPQLLALRAVHPFISSDVIDRHLSASRLSSVAAAKDAVSELTEEEFSACIADLDDQRLLAELVNSLAGGAFNFVGSLFCRHWICLAVGRGTPLSIFGNTPNALEVNPEFCRVFQEVIAGVYSQDVDAIAEQLTPWFSGLGDKSPGPQLHSRCCNLLVSAPAPWQQFYSHLEEHFTDDERPPKEQQPQEWDWLCKNAQYLLVFTDYLPIRQTQGYVEHLVRRLMALTRCLRGLNSEAAYSLRGTPFEVTPSTPADCRMLALPLESPPANSTEHFRSFPFEVGPDTHEFRSAGHLFINGEDFARLEEAGLARAWAWLLRDKSQRAEEVRHALECFETALGLGASTGSVPARIGSGWQVIGLLTSLESVFCGDEAEGRSLKVREGVERSLRGVGLPEPEVLERAQGVRRAYDARNKLVHEGRGGVEDEQVDDLAKTVAMTLRRVIMNRLPA